ncbi:MAG: AmmeMemoRadiSam system protein B [Candidatus Aminicenantes bacterium]|nr:AmmeMemoRadiSam system protein B [Candidatus Aminicenantes bacterium]
MKQIALFILFSLFLLVPGQDKRPVRDDIGFCWQRPQMKRLMDYLAANDRHTVAIDNLVAGISPHDDYLYAGRVYYPLFKELRTREVVIFGVTHGTVRKEIGDPQNVLILDEYTSWAGLGGNVEISPLREWIKNKLPRVDYLISNQAHALEHSIEALLPFLQFNNPDIKITPIMVTAMPWEKMNELAERLASVLAAYIRGKNLQPGRDIFFLISADANHYGRDFNNSPFGEDEKAHVLGTEQDRRIARAAFSGPLDKDKIRGLTQALWGATYRDYRNTYWCGKYDIPFGLLVISKTMHKAVGRKLKGQVLRYSDTYSEGVIPLKKAGFGITAPFSLKHWVGFLSAGFSLDR